MTECVTATVALVGILCSHCALVHSCKLFGACADFRGSIDHLHTKDGRTLRELM